MNAWWKQITRAWWILWTGFECEADVRRYLEHEVRRFGGAVSWLPKSRR